MDPQTTVGYFGIQAGMRIADFGSGSGFFTIFMAKLAGPDGLVTAIDVMDSALDSVRAKAKAEALDNIDTIRSNLELPGSSGLADGSQDLVLLKNVLFQTEKKQAMLAEANRVLKIAGKLALIDWKKGADGLGPPDQFRTEAESMRQLAENGGFNFIDFIDADVFHYGMMFRKI